jgi:periplasmic protein TonB
MDNKFVLSQSFNDIVFEKRNKKYGAYEIRRKYMRYTLLAGAAAILFFTCGTFTWAFVQEPEKIVRTIEVPMDITPPSVDQIKKDEEIIKPKLEVLPQQPAGGQVATAITSVIDVVDEDSAVPPSNIVVDMGATGPVGPVVGPGNGPCLDCPPSDSVVVVPPVTIRDWTPFPPECPGLDEHLKKNTHYPAICREEGIEGVVYIEFIVDTKGDYRDVKVIRGAHPAMNKEALRVMSIMPKWTPAKDENGSLVDFIMRKPIRFSLK